MLALTEPHLTSLLDCVAAAERAATSSPPDGIEMLTQVRSIRYILVEIADGPIAAFMADAAAQILGDGIGRLFS